TTISTGKMAILPTPDLVGASDPAFYAKCHHRAAGRRIKQKSPARGGAFRAPGVEGIHNHMFYIVLLL
ncbi:UNVERIFIED_CONTAM: hypothetical protein QO022_14420, partial [Pseudomonas aeruginosa]